MQHALTARAMLFSSNIQIAPCPLAILCPLQMQHNTISETPIKRGCKRRNVYRITICRLLTANNFQAPRTSLINCQGHYITRAQTAPAWRSIRNQTVRHDSKLATDLSFVGKPLCLAVLQRPLFRAKRNVNPGLCSKVPQLQLPSGYSRHLLVVSPRLHLQVGLF